MYCKKCGSVLNEESIFCSNCGCPANNCSVENTNIYSSSNGMKTAIKVFMIIGCVVGALLYVIPLAWTIPMTIVYFKKVENKEEISTGFKVCCLLFVNLVAGILMLCDND